MRRWSQTQKLLHAVDGFSHACRTQRHMRAHVFAVLVLTFVGLWLEFQPIEILVLIAAWAFVLFAEMMNTAVESVFDLITETYHPVVKHAKDIAAGAVLIAWVNAMFVVAILFLQEKRLRGLIASGMLGAKGTNTQLYIIWTVIGIMLVLLMSFLLKLRAQHGSFLFGGLVSVHSAVGFFLSAVVFYTAATNPNLTKFLALLLALVVAQSRVDAGVHSFQEVAFGAFLGFLLGTIMLRLF
jgi:diacylglycerol kinase (ATP)